MKWPEELVIIRHGQSEYNVLRDLKNEDPQYKEFKRAHARNHRSQYARTLAAEMRKKYALKESDVLTSLTSHGAKMSYTTGELLRSVAKIPHVIFVSPYTRTEQTRINIMSGWPALGAAKIVREDRIREQEHGLATLYNDWRVFEVMHPEQKELRELQGEYWYRYPQGESVSDVRERTRSMLSTLVREYSGYRVWFITHHLTILSIRSLLERLSPEQFIDLDKNEKPVNCGVTFYRGLAGRGRDGQLELVQYNTKLY